jgi:hypothetical protein
MFAADGAPPALDPEAGAGPGPGFGVGVGPGFVGGFGAGGEPGNAAAPSWTARFVRTAPRRVSQRVRVSVSRLALATVSSIGAAWIHEHHDPGALCPLRRLTGVPCPMCGSTTVFMEAGAGHWTEALGANPFTVLAFLVFLAAPLGLIDPVSTWANLPTRRRNIGLGVILALSWIWQLHRFGFILSGTRFS